MLEEAHEDNVIRWSPGGTRPGHLKDPYWRVSSGPGGKSPQIPAGDWPDGPAQYTQPGGGTGGTGDTGGDPGDACTIAYNGLSCMPSGDTPIGGDDDEGGDPILDPLDPFLLVYVVSSCPSEELY